MSPRLLLISLMILTTACQDTSAPVSKLPTRPDILLATPKTGEIFLEWHDLATDESRYRVEVSSNGGPWLLLVETAPNVTSATHPNVLHGITYSYRVAACNELGCSDWAQASTKWQTGAPPVLTHLTVIGISANSATIMASAQAYGLPVRFRFVIRKDGEALPVQVTEKLTRAPNASDADGGASASIAHAIYGLEPETNYDVYAVVENDIGQGVAIEPRVFKTTAQGPPILLAPTTLPSALLVRINANGLVTYFRFEIVRAGETFERPLATHSGIVSAGVVPAGVVVFGNFDVVTQSGGRYEWRVVAENASGSVILPVQQWSKP
jgi:hypothetical protein